MADHRVSCHFSARYRCVSALTIGVPVKSPAAKSGGAFQRCRVNPRLVPPGRPQ